MAVSLFHRHTQGAGVRPVLTSLLIGGLIVSLPTHISGAQELYRDAVVDGSGQLRLTTTAGRVITPAKDSDQVGFDEVAISRDHRRVGWLALYPNCCTTYPTPLRLVVRTAGRDQVFNGNGLAIWQWAFVDRGKRVAYRQAPVHGSASEHYELYDLETGRLVSVFDMLPGAAKLPRWAQGVSDPNDRKDE
jgi:hypothetical protein